MSRPGKTSAAASNSNNTNGHTALLFFRAESKARIVAHKPWTLEITCDNDGIVSSYTLCCKISEEKVKRSKNKYIDIPAARLEPGNDCSITPDGHAWIIYVETKGNEGKGRMKQKYALLKRNAAYAIGGLPGMKVLSVKLLNERGDAVTTLPTWSVLQAPPAAAPSTSGGSIAAAAAHTPMKAKPLTSLPTPLQRLIVPPAPAKPTPSVTMNEFFGGLSTPTAVDIASFDLGEFIGAANEEDASVDVGSVSSADTPYHQPNESPIPWARVSSVETLDVATAPTATHDDLPASPMVLPPFTRSNIIPSTVPSPPTIASPTTEARGTKRSLAIASANDCERFTIAPKSWDVGRVNKPVTLSMRLPAPVVPSSVSVMFGAQSLPIARCDTREVAIIVPVPPMAFTALALAGHASEQNVLRLRVRVSILIDGKDRWSSYFHYRMGGEEFEPEVPDIDDTNVTSPCDVDGVDAAPSPSSTCHDAKTPSTPTARTLVKAKRHRTEAPVQFTASYESLDAVHFPTIPPSPSVSSITSASTALSLVSST